MKMLKQGIFSKNLFKLPKKNIYYNPKVGYFAPECNENQKYVQEIKDWLLYTNPKMLCIYFTNDWNPIAKQGEEGYPDFLKKNLRVTHMKINVDKYPKLKWFFNSRVK